MDYIKDAKTDFILSNDIRIPIRVRGRKEIIKDIISIIVQKE